MSKNITLTIIIPVYNVERYLGGCLDSILSVNGIEDVEIILVDDGSTDDSPGIADRYSEDYDNVCCYHISNSGPSISRNIGLEKASGKYVFFCDSDDLVVSEQFSGIVEMSKTDEVDIILWDAVLIDENGDISDRKDRDYYIHRGLENDGRIITGKTVVEKQLISRGDYPATVWLGIFRKDFLLENNLFFENGILHEDELWTQKSLLYAQSVKYISKIIYMYRIHDGSITNPQDNDWTKHIESLFHVYPSLFHFSDDYLSGNRLKRLFDANMAHRYLYMIFKYDFYKYGYGKRIDKKQLWARSKSLKDKIKIIILLLKELLYQ